MLSLIDLDLNVDGEGNDSNAELRVEVIILFEEVLRKRDINSNLSLFFDELLCSFF